jgi:hypothetical protein
MKKKPFKRFWIENERVDTPASALETGFLRRIFCQQHFCNSLKARISSGATLKETNPPVYDTLYRRACKQRVYKFFSAFTNVYRRLQFELDWKNLAPNLGFSLGNCLRPGQNRKAHTIVVICWSRVSPTVSPNYRKSVAVDNNHRISDSISSLDLRI